MYTLILTACRGFASLSGDPAVSVSNIPNFESYFLANMAGQQWLNSHGPKSGFSYIVVPQTSEAYEIMYNINKDN